jgi:hypothetical protein
MMDVETWLSGEQCIAKGFCDEMTEEEPVTNSAEMPRFKNLPQNLAKKTPQALPSQGEPANRNNPPVNPGQQQEPTVNRLQRIALLNSWGINVKDEASVTDARLEELVNMGKVSALAAFSGQPPVAIVPPAAAPAAAATVSPEAAEATRLLTELRNERATSRRGTIRNRLDQLVSEGRITGNSVDAWLQQAYDATDHPTNGNPVLANLALLEPREPGSSPVNIEMGTEELSMEKLNRAVNQILQPLQNVHRNARTPDEQDRKVIGLRNKQMNMLIKNHAKYVASAEHPHGELTGPLRAAWDRWALGNAGLGTVQNANTMSADLLRQVIFSEIMRAFRRKFASLSIFAHKYENVPLEGNDYIKVPYYPLNTTASTEYTQAAGYVIGATAQTSAKSIFVAGKGDGVASAGAGRKYQSLKFNGYEINRQPWLDIAQLCLMAGEQLAIDVRADILGSKISRANFGNAIWSGASGAFDHTVVSQYLKLAAINAFWPEGAGNVIVTPTMYTSLISDPAVSEFMKSGNTDALRKAKVGELYGFGSVDYDALLPVANYIRGGDGAVTAGADPYLSGFMALPSALLIATAPIMPPPGVLRKLLAFDMVTDEQTGLTFSYRYWGNEATDEDNNIIECTYGSEVGEVAALKRLTSAGL